MPDTDMIRRILIIFRDEFLSNRSTNRIFNVINEVLLFDQEAQQHGCNRFHEYSGGRSNGTSVRSFVGRHDEFLDFSRWISIYNRRKKLRRGIRHYLSGIP